MTIVRAFPILFLGLGMIGCQSAPYTSHGAADAQQKLEANQPAGEKLPDIVALPPSTTQPYTPPQALSQPVVTSVPAASRADRTIDRAPAPLEDDLVVPRTARARASSGPVRHRGHRDVEVAQVSTTRGGHGKTYTVQRGDTLQRISMKFFGTTKHWHKIFEANKAKLKKPDTIVVGTVITIP